MTDQEKFQKLFDELGIKYEVNGNTLYLENTECDGAQEFGISFWDGEDYPKGKFHEFWVVPEEKVNRTERKTYAEKYPWELGKLDPLPEPYASYIREQLGIPKEHSDED